MFSARPGASILRPGRQHLFRGLAVGGRLAALQDHLDLVSEQFLALQECLDDAFEIVAPTYSVLAEPPVAWLDKNTAAHGTAELAKAYLEYLYTPEAQDVIGANFYRPRSAEAAAKYAANFPKIELVTIDDPAFGGWTKAQAAHFADGGIFDKIYIPSVK